MLPPQSPASELPATLDVAVACLCPEPRLWTLLLTTSHSVIEASFIPSHYGRAAHTGGKRGDGCWTILFLPAGKNAFPWPRVMEVLRVS